MTCQSCSCEFCYLCGRRYVQIPFIGQHSNKFRYVFLFIYKKISIFVFDSSMFGCPYNFHPERPWLRRTIRGVIATGVVVTSPVIVASVVIAAITVLPPLGIYKLIKNIRDRRRTPVTAGFPLGEAFLLEPDLDDPQALAHTAFQFDLHGDLAADEIMRVLRQRIGGFSFTQVPNDDDNEQSDNEVDIDFPLSIFSGMDVEHLFSDDDFNNSPSDFRTCPTTPAFTIRKGHSRSLNNLTANNSSSINRHHSMITEH
jgi:hypothetical protein